MSKEFQAYAKEAMTHVNTAQDAVIALPAVTAWWQSQGRDQFADAFKTETTLGFGGQTNQGQLVAAAVPKNWRDLEAKAQTSPYYRAHAQWFTEEMDAITARVPASPVPADTMACGNVWRFAKQLLLDSVWLFEVHGADLLKAPGVYGIYRNREQHLLGFFHGARQVIYGHGAWGLSFADNHSDIATSIVRQAIELRIRRALGVTSKVSRVDGGFEPIALSRLISVLDEHKNEIKLPIAFEHIVRLKHWADMYLHAGIKDFAWAPARVITFLAPFLAGGKAPGVISVNAGFQITREAFDLMRAQLKKDNEDAAYELPLWDAEDCDAVFI